MKQLSSSELNNMSREDMAAMILQMQQEQLQLQQQIHTLNEKIAIMNARHFGRSTEKLETLPGVMSRVMRKFCKSLVEIYFRGRVNRPLVTSRRSGRKGSRAAVRRSSCP